MSDTESAETPREQTAALDPLPGEWKRVSPKYVVVDVIGTLISGLVMTAIAAFVVAAIGNPVLWVIPGAILAISLIYTAFTRRRVRAIGYRMREDDLVVRRGILFRRIVAVPYGRMQLVDITRGPIDRALGLSQLKLVTAAAASGVVIPGLVESDADALRDHLVDLAESRRAGL